MRKSEKIDQVLDIIEDFLDSDEIDSECFAEYLSKRAVESLQNDLMELSDYFTSKGK